MSLLSASDVTLMHAVMVEISNATLTAINAPGALERNGDPTVGAALWTGTAEAFLERHDREVLSGGAQVQDRRTTLRVFDEAGADVADMLAGPDWAASSVVVIDNRGASPVTRRWTIVGMEHESDETLNSVLLTINDERAA